MTPRDDLRALAEKWLWSAALRVAEEIHTRREHGLTCIEEMATPIYLELCALAAAPREAKGKSTGHLAIDVLLGVAHETPAPRPAEDIERIYELLTEFGVADTDALKHRLEDHERWRKAILSGELRDTDFDSTPAPPATRQHRCVDGNVKPWKLESCANCSRETAPGAGAR